MESEFSLLAKRIADSCNLEVEILELENVEPVELCTEIQDVIESSAKSLGLRSRRMPSGAGHDAQSLSRICRSGMVFIPSVDGVSHSPMEFSNWEDCLNGANILLRAAVVLANSAI